MTSFDNFVSFDAEKDLIRFRCQHHEKLVLCGVTRAALLHGSSQVVSTRERLLQLYSEQTAIIQRAVLHRLQTSRPDGLEVLVIDVADLRDPLRKLVKPALTAGAR